MFSALKFIAASVIVALFGGFLMVGVFTTQPSDDVTPAAASAAATTEATGGPTEAPTSTVRTDILPGVALTVEAVEPGVFRVLDDGVRDLRKVGGDTNIVAGHDDGIWLLRSKRFFRLGADLKHAWPMGGRFDPWSVPFEVTPDGTVWVRKPTKGIDQRELFSLEGDGWTRKHSPPGDVVYIEATPDGTLLALWRSDGSIPAVGYFGPSGWTAVGEEAWGTVALYPTAAGDVYSWDCEYSGESPNCIFSLDRYEDGAWSELARFDGYPVVAVAPDGTVWVLDIHSDPEWQTEALARFAHGTWEQWAPDELPDMTIHTLGGKLFMGAPDGSLWAGTLQRGRGGDDGPPARGLVTWEDLMGQPDTDEAQWQCGGLLRFDGTTAERFLRGHCVTMDIATDGSVWVLSSEGKSKELYVITPEAVEGG